jgi:hypothetical protein
VQPPQNSSKDKRDLPRFQSRRVSFDKGWNLRPKPPARFEGKPFNGRAWKKAGIGRFFKLNPAIGQNSNISKNWLTLSRI